MRTSSSAIESDMSDGKHSLPSTSNRMLRAPVPTEVHEAGNSLSTGTNVVDSDTPLRSVDVASAITKALSAAGLTSADACAYMDLDKSQWSKQLKGQDNHQVSFQRLLRLPRSFWREFLPLLGDPMQITMTTQDVADFTMLRIISLVEEIGTFAVRMRALRRAG
jgi:hypothetical protein